MTVMVRIESRELWATYHRSDRRCPRRGENCGYVVNLREAMINLGQPCVHCFPPLPPKTPYTRRHE